MSSRHQQAKEIFLDASELEGVAREEYLARVCGSDAELRAEVDFLLLGHERPRMLVDEPLLRSPRLTPFLAAAAEAEKLPERIGKYRILGRVGEGGMGVVFEAEQGNPKRRVVLKMVRPGFFSPRMQRRLEREVQILARLQHPGIEQVFEADSVDFPHGRVPYFVAEFIDGLTLTEYARENHLSTVAKLELLAKICDAVQFAHQNLVIHRDLKPGNILVDTQGQPKVVDFGLARALDAESSEWTQVSASGQVVGTLPYISPEQLEDDGPPPDTRADVYALGVILFELLSGQLPYDLAGKSAANAARLIRDHAPRNLGALDRALRGDVTTIVQKALAREPADRYRSAGELAEDLRRYLRHEPILARRASTPYVVRKLILRHRLPAALLAALFLVMNVGGVTVTLLYFRAQRESQTARRTAAFLKDTFNLIHTDQGGPVISIRAVLDDAAQRIDATLARSPEVAGELREMVARGYYSVEAYDESLHQYKDALAATIQVFGREHLNTAHLYRQLGDVCYTTLRNDEAERWYREALRIYRGVRSPKGGWTGEVLGQLGALAVRRGDLTASAALLEEAYAVMCQYHGEDAYGTTGTAIRLARLRTAQGCLDEADQLINRAIAVLRADDHPNDNTMTQALNTLANVRLAQGRVAEAVALLREVLDAYRAKFGDGSAWVLQQSVVLAEALQTAKELSAAEAVLLTVHESLTRRAPPDAAGMQQVALALGELYEAWDKQAEAAAWRARAEEVPEPVRPATTAPAAAQTGA